MNQPPKLFSMILGLLAALIVWSLTRWLVIHLGLEEWILSRW